MAGRDALAAAVLRAGGLLAFGRTRTYSPATFSPDLPRTLFEKIVARHALATADTPAPAKPGDGGFVRADWRFIHEYYTGMCAHMLDQAYGEALGLHEPETIVTFEDHLSYVHRSPVHVSQNLVGDVLGLSRAHRAFAARFGLVEHGTLQPQLDVGDAGNTGSQGISHAVMAEQYALPGQLIVGTDSHTPHSGALGCVAFGVGTTDMANAFVTGAVRLTLPATLRVEFDGALPAGVTAKDLVLHLLADAAIRAGAGVGKVFEFGGDVIRGLSTDERATLTNMTAELGGFTGLVEPDAETVRFLRERRGIDVSLEPWMRSDAGAQYADVIRIDCSAMTPMVARPGDPGNGVPLAAIAERPRLDIAYGGSCTAGKREDFDHYHAVLAWAAERGLRVAEGVKLYLQFGTVAVRDYCIARGYLAAFEAVGAELLQPACGACANCGPGSSTSAEQVTVSAINRNFPGRSGPGPGLAGQSTHGCGECDRRAAVLVRGIARARRVTLPLPCRCRVGDAPCRRHPPRRRERSQHSVRATRRRSRVAGRDQQPSTSACSGRCDAASVTTKTTRRAVPPMAAGRVSENCLAASRADHASSGLYNVTTWSWCSVSPAFSPARTRLEWPSSSTAQ